jgi:Xaa-Pro aminopeptidase
MTNHESNPHLRRACVKSLRAELRRRGLDGFIVPIADEHLTEYVGDYAKRMAWLTGFSGSAGTAVILASGAAVFVDGRYFLQAQAELDASTFEIVSVLETDVASWIIERAACGAKLGYDPWLHSARSAKILRRQLNAAGLALINCETNPVDSIWADRPGPCSDPLWLHPDELAGETAASKRARVAAWLVKEDADLLLLTALDSIAWTFNLRGSDTEYIPVARAFAVIGRDGGADLFVDPSRLSVEVEAALGPGVRIHAYSDFLSHVRSMRARLVVDCDQCADAIIRACCDNQIVIIDRVEPVQRMKALKNDAEILGMRNAHLRDGAALVQFLHWLAGQTLDGQVTELGAARKVEEFRQQTTGFLSLPFATISAYGANAALPHYTPLPGSALSLLPGSVYLIDSGGQYRDGTTDITRTVALGMPSDEIREGYTRVLKGHVMLASTVFPSGTRGIQLDALARRTLWQVGLDYAHGTGHGVGAYLAVHEGPQRIANQGSECLEPIEAGMTFSNEPGLYKHGKFGVRLENVMAVRQQSSGLMLEFETLSLAPFDWRLIDSRLLSFEERQWLTAYHDRMLVQLAPLLPDGARAWLAAECAGVNRLLA